MGGRQMGTMLIEQRFHAVPAYTATGPVAVRHPADPTKHPGDPREAALPQPHASAARCVQRCLRGLQPAHRPAPASHPVPPAARNVPPHQAGHGPPPDRQSGCPASQGPPPGTLRARRDGRPGTRRCFVIAAAAAGHDPAARLSVSPGAGSAPSSRPTVTAS